MFQAFEMKQFWKTHFDEYFYISCQISKLDRYFSLKEWVFENVTNFLFTIILCNTSIFMAHSLPSYLTLSAWKMAINYLNFFFRIRKEFNGGAWCPKNVLDKTSYEYLQIDLDKLMVITKVETQGRFGNGLVSFTTGESVALSRVMCFIKKCEGWIYFWNFWTFHH